MLCEVCGYVNISCSQASTSHVLKSSTSSGCYGNQRAMVVYGPDHRAQKSTLYPRHGGR